MLHIVVTSGGEVRDLESITYPPYWPSGDQRILLGQLAKRNLNTLGSLYEAYYALEAGRTMSKLEIGHTPKVCG